MAKKEPVSNGEEASLTADPKLHHIAAAALLLLGDLTEDQQVDVMRAVAKPGITILDPMAPLKSHLERAYLLAEEAVGAVDGSSGLGRIAAANASTVVKALRDAVRMAGHIVGVRSK